MSNNGTNKGSGAKGGKVVSVFCSVIGTIGIIIIILLCLPVTAPRVAGVQIYNVESGSMEPALKTGSIVYVTEEDPRAIYEGDIIVFNQNGMTVTHRVLENNLKAEEFITKGDANEEADPTPVRYGSLIGYVRFSIPYLGGFFVFFTSLKGKIILFAILAASFVLMLVGSNLRSEKADKTSGAEEKDSSENK